jgi:hypothetical protein
VTDIDKFTEGFAPGAYLKSIYSEGSLRASFTNVRLGLKWLAKTNAPAYKNCVIITIKIVIAY